MNGRATSGIPASTSERKILDAARGEFERYGVRRTTIDDIARRAGVSRRTLYRSFTSKDALFERLMVEDATALFHRLGEVAEGRDPQGAIVECFTVGFQVIREMSLVQRILESEPEVLSPTARNSASLIQLGAQFIAGSLRRSGVTMPDEDLNAVSEILYRLAVSLLLNPEGQLDTFDSRAVRRYAERYLARLVW
jgi:TetR/AcrR family transcriptional regulator